MSEKINPQYISSVIRKLKNASNKENEVVNIRKELEERFNLTKPEIVLVIESLEKYFHNEEIKQLEKDFSRRYVAYSEKSVNYEFNLGLTDNSEILKALEKAKKYLGV